jgi:hypothetical protein
VRVEGQFTFNATAQMLNAALAGAGLARAVYPSRRQFEWAKRSAIPLMNSLACVSFMTSFDEFSIPPAP